MSGSEEITDWSKVKKPVKAGAIAGGTDGEDKEEAVVAAPGSGGPRVVVERDPVLAVDAKDVPWGRVETLSVSPAAS